MAPWRPRNYHKRLRRGNVNALELRGSSVKGIPKGAKMPNWGIHKNRVSLEVADVHSGNLPRANYSPYPVQNYSTGFDRTLTRAAIKEGGFTFFRGLGWVSNVLFFYELSKDRIATQTARTQMMIKQQPYTKPVSVRKFKYNPDKYFKKKRYKNKYDTINISGPSGSGPKSSRIIRPRF